MVIFVVTKVAIDSKNVLSIKENINLTKNLNVTAQQHFNHSSNNVINFKTDPNTFTQTLSNCLIDDNCKVIFHHIQKTGGKTVEYQMFHASPSNVITKQSGYQPCCFEKTLKYFKKSKEKLCKKKFTSYEVTNTQFEKIVSICMKINKKYNKLSRTVALVSYRDPSNRTLSRINAFCNVRFDSRPKDVQEACLSCIYEDYKDVFDSFALATNEVYEDILHTTRMTMQDVDVISFDTIDINDMFIMLQKSLSNISFPLIKTRNSARHHRCTNFTIKPRLYEKLERSREIYKTLTGV